MDVRMPVCDGVQAMREIHEYYPWIRILVLTTFDDEEYTFQSLQVGALGYLLKRTPASEIAASIRLVAQGYSQLGPMIALKVFSQLKPFPRSDDTISDLRKREVEALKLVGAGKNNPEIAQELKFFCIAFTDAFRNTFIGFSRKLIVIEAEKVLETNAQQH
jgi:DNA-binding NarL/FixJ family response regulator